MGFSKENFINEEKVHTAFATIHQLKGSPERTLNRDTEIEKTPISIGLFSLSWITMYSSLDDCIKAIVKRNKERKVNLDDVELVNNLYEHRSILSFLQASLQEQAHLKCRLAIQNHKISEENW